MIKPKYQINEQVFGVIQGPLRLFSQFPANPDTMIRFPYLELDRIAEIAQLNGEHVYRLKCSSVLFFETQIKRI